MKNLSLRAKLFAVLGMLSVVAIVIAFVGITRLAHMNDSLKTIVEVTSTKQLLAARMRQNLLAMHRAEKNFILAETKEEMDRHARSMADFDKEYLERRNRINQLVSERDKEDLSALDNAVKQYQTLQQQVCDLSLRNTNLQAFELSVGAGRELYDKAEALMRAVANRADQLVSSQIEEVKKQTNSEELNRMLTATDAAATRALESARVLQDCLVMQRAEKNLILARTDEEMRQHSRSVDDSYSRMKTRIAEIEKTASEEGKKDLAEFQAAWTAWMDNHKRIQDLSLENSNNEARILSGTKGRETLESAEAALRRLAERCDEDMNQASQVAAQMYATARVLMIGVSVGGISLAVVLGLFIIRGLVLTLRHTIGQLAEGANQVNEAAGQVSQASQQLAEGASEQASSLEETSSALEELAAMTRTNASNAQQANQLSIQASAAANQGDQTMEQLNGAMHAINESSEKISKIIKVIEEIAFQTNLLALNAAVEAARAGEHGKGFAVVADEVRNLAQRAAQAAKETTVLIEDSVNRAREGNQVAGDVGKALGSIVADVQHVSELINGIAQASQEQAQGVDQINTAVSQMDKVTQVNASSAEEAASASEELSSQALATKSIVEELTRIVEGARADAGRSPAVSTRPTAQTRGGKRARPAKSFASAEVSGADHHAMGTSQMPELQDF